MDTHTLDRIPLEEGSAHRRDLYLFNTQRWQERNSHVRSEIRKCNPRSERPQAYALDRATTGGRPKLFINLLKPTGYVMHQQVWHSTTVRSAHAVFIWEQTATCATYSINWLVFITEMKSVYSAVRTGSLNTAVCHSSIKGLRVQIVIIC